MRSNRQSLRRALRLGATIAAVGIVTAIDRTMHVNSATAAFTFLLLILGLATRVGLQESIAASLVSMLAYNFYFLPPVGTLTIADPQNWVALCVFLATAITASHLSANARRKAQEAQARQEELQRMYDFSRALLLGDDERSLERQILRQISELFRVPDVWFYNRVMDTVSRSSAEASQLSEPLLRKVAETDTPWHDEERNASVVPVSLGGRSLASLGVAGAAGVSEVGLRAIAHLAAIAMERARARELESSAEATRQSEQLKSTLLDALAHEFKTPLTSIKAAASAMLSRQHLNEVDGEFVTVIDEESNRLSQLVTDAIELARIGSQPVHLRRGRCDAGEMVSSVLDQLRGFSAGRDIDVHVATNVPSMEADRRLIELALRQLVSNAVRYSPAGSPIRIGVTAEDEAILFQVSNEGAGIPKAEQHLVFEKFYRGREMRGRIPGTGLGLSIAREIAEAHGGRLWLESEPGHGARFLFTLPALTLRTGTLQGEQQAAR